MVGSERGLRPISAAHVAAAGYAALSAATTWRLGPHRYPDSPTYLHLSFIGHAARLWAVPLLYELPGDHARIWAQTLLSVAAWTTLALVLAAGQRTAGRRLAVAVAVLAVASTPQVLQWNSMLLSESLSLSAGTGAVAAWAAYGRGRRRWQLVAGLALLGAWTFCRQTDVLVLPVVALGAVWAVRRDGRGRVAAVAGCCALLLAWGTVDGFGPASAGIRDWNATALVAWSSGQPQVARWWTAHGLPVAPGRLAGDPWQIRPALEADPAVEAWIHCCWTSTYARYLASHAGAVTADAARQAPGLLTSSLEEDPVPSPWPSRLLRAYWGPLSLGALALVACLLRRRLSGLCVVLLSAAGWAYIATLLLDAGELQRPVMPAAVILHLALWMAVLEPGTEADSPPARPARAGHREVLGDLPERRDVDQSA